MYYPPFFPFLLAILFNSTFCTPQDLSLHYAKLAGSAVASPSDFSETDRPKYLQTVTFDFLRLAHPPSILRKRKLLENQNEEGTGASETSDNESVDDESGDEDEDGFEDVKEDEDEDEEDEEDAGVYGIDADEDGEDESAASEANATPSNALD